MKMDLTLNNLNGLYIIKTNQTIPNKGDVFVFPYNFQFCLRCFDIASLARTFFSSFIREGCKRYLKLSIGLHFFAFPTWCSLWFNSYSYSWSLSFLLWSPCHRRAMFSQDSRQDWSAFLYCLLDHQCDQTTASLGSPWYLLPDYFSEEG